MRRINLLPWREAQRTDLKRRFSRQTMGLLLGLFLLLLLIYGQTESLLFEQRKRNTFLQQQINTLQTDINRYQGVDGGGNNSKEGLKVLSGLRQERAALVRTLDDLPRRVPEGVTLSEIKQQNRVLHISGVADTSAQVSDFLRQLEQSSAFHSARLSVIKLADKGGTKSAHTFVLEVSMQQGAQR